MTNRPDEPRLCLPSSKSKMQCAKILRSSTKYPCALPHRLPQGHRKRAFRQGAGIDKRRIISGVPRGPWSAGTGDGHGVRGFDMLVFELHMQAGFMDHAGLVPPRSLRDKCNDC